MAGPTVPDRTAMQSRSATAEPFRTRALDIHFVSAVWCCKAFAPPVAFDCLRVGVDPYVWTTKGNQQPRPFEFAVTVKNPIHVKHV